MRSLVFEDEEQVQATFILPREGLSPEISEPNKTQADVVPLNPDERPTSAVDVSPTPPQTPQTSASDLHQRLHHPRHRRLL